MGPVSMAVAVALVSEEGEDEDERHSSKEPQVVQKPRCA